ncbi:MAG TPA: vitamin K epoxide reductase family protein [Jatrophihabitans sp.]|nr:vitamin K epoxide reductase family protein [Jatrophihabitans sp.]
MTGGTRERAAFTASGVLALAAAVLALAVSAYLTVEHYNTSLGLACPETGTINCQKVTTSTYSVIAGVPVAVVGLVYFVVMTVLLALPTRRREVEVLRLVGAAAGVGMVFYLVYVELFQVDAICLWCTAVHVLTVVMFAAVLWGRAGAASHD